MTDRAEWMPIETAPKDGTRLLVFVPPYGSFTAHNTFILLGGPKEDRWRVSGLINREAEPTHWMPLPPPPEVEP